MHERLELLWPRPQKIDVTQEFFELPQKITLALKRPTARSLFSAQRLKRVLNGLNITTDLFAIDDWKAPLSSAQKRVADIQLAIEDCGGESPDSYQLEVKADGVSVTGSDEAGLFYGVCTLFQLIRLYHFDQGGRRVIPGVRISDWPEFRHRGVLLDVSRDKVPRMSTLFGLVDWLASLKINQVQLYFEHTFAYRGHQAVWRDASPFTGEEVLELDNFCRQRCVELVPHQNTFGHMHRWLIHEPYRQIAECPEGIEHPFSLDQEPYSLCPVDPRSLQLVEDLCDQLLPHFQSRQFNVGLDETIDLGRGRSKEACDKIGAPRVYLQYLTNIHGMLMRRGRTMQFWSDIIRCHPELVKELPGKAIALEWGYEKQHLFEKHGALFSDAGIPFYLCPGTSSWNSVAGRLDNALANIREASLAGVKTGAQGLIVTDWGDNGHWQPLPVSYPGFLMAAGCFWNVYEASNARASDLPTLLDAHAFADRAKVVGQTLCALGNAYQKTGVELINRSILFSLLSRPNTVAPAGKLGQLTEKNLALTLHYIDEATSRLSQARLPSFQPTPELAMTDTPLYSPTPELIVEELHWVARMLRLACEIGMARMRAGWEKPLDALPHKRKKNLAQTYGELLEEYRGLWLKRNRPGGLVDSARRMERMVKSLAVD